MMRRIHRGAIHIVVRIHGVSRDRERVPVRAEAVRVTTRQMLALDKQSIIAAAIRVSFVHVDVSSIPSTTANLILPTFSASISD